MSRLIKKKQQQNGMCAQRRLRSAWESAKSDQSLHCPHEENFGPKLSLERTAKTLIRLGACPGWSESSVGVQSFCWFCHEVAHISLNLSFLNCLRYISMCPNLMPFLLTNRLNKTESGVFISWVTSFLPKDLLFRTYISIWYRFRWHRLRR